MIWYCRSVETNALLLSHIIMPITYTIYHIKIYQLIK